MSFEKVMSIGSEGDGQFTHVEDVAISNENGERILDVMGVAHAHAQRFNKATGEFLRRFGGQDVEDENLEKPEGIAVDDNDHVYVADYDTGYIKSYDTNENSNRWLMTFGEYGSESGRNFKSECMSSHDGRLYLSQVGNAEADVFGIGGKFLLSFGGLGSAPGLLNDPAAAKANSQGNIYVAEIGDDRIDVHKPTSGSAS